MEEKNYIIRQLLADLMNLKIENATLRYHNEKQKEELQDAQQDHSDNEHGATEASDADKA